MIGKLDAKFSSRMINDPATDQWDAVHGVIDGIQYTVFSD